MVFGITWDRRKNLAYEAEVREAQEREDRLLEHIREASLADVCAWELEDLSYAEKLWRGYSEYLWQDGYVLRPRFRCGWEPSWRTVNRYTVPTYAEDAVPLPVTGRHTIDAVRSIDGRLVSIKRVAAQTVEASVLQLFTEDVDFRNHCIPVYEVVHHKHEVNTLFFVSPFLRPFDDPAFEYIGEVVDCVDQLLEGLEYLHSRGLAHGCCTADHIFMDAVRMYPYGFHPTRMNLTLDIRSQAWHYPRIMSFARPRYYFANFENAIVVSPEEKRKDCELQGLPAARGPGEPDTPTSPFAQDVRNLGEILRQTFFERYANLGFLEGVVAPMTGGPDRECPSSLEILTLWRAICVKIPLTSRICRLRMSEEGDARHVLLASIDFLKVFVLTLMRFLAYWPSVYHRVAKIIVMYF